MAHEYEVALSKAAEGEQDAIVTYWQEHYGDRPAVRLDLQFDEAIDGLAANPTRHTRVRYLIGRQFV